MTVMIDKHICILLIEDEISHAELVRRAFEERTTEVNLTVARSLAEARTWLAKSDPDLAIIDLRLPDGRGIELLQDEGERQFPVVVMTGHGDEEVAVEVMKAGALDYVVKTEETLTQMPHIAARALREWHHITERRRAEEQLRESNRELEAFVYTASHDLRSPLTPILAYTELLRDIYGERLDSQAIEFLNEIERQGYRMLNLLEDLLGLARAGHMEPPPAPVDVRQIVQEVVREQSAANPALPITPPPEPLLVRFIPESAMVQIFSNLIGNARRYAGNGNAPIEVGAQRSGERVLFSVCDHGPGIPESERSRIFETFYRGSTAAGVVGSGIGLATVRKVARAYGGGAWVEETPGGGSTFWVEMVDGQSKQSTDDENTPLRLMQIVHGDYCEWPWPAPATGAHGDRTSG
jgi:signal transduction histidine kinase